ncbi:MAG: AAA family ATPase [Candidatus Methanomethylophilaceae archaeon]|nr:AAA family ATPase [Candidatus Methanomethylophilaceae archaeon]
MSPPRIPIGVKDFRKLAKGGYLFSDKSMLVREIMDSGSDSVMITRPRRFGKTLAISMLDRFLNVAYREEESRDDTFAGLKITRSEDYREWSEGVKNRYPVIRMDMSSIVVESKEDLRSQILKRLKETISIEFGYLLDSPRLSDLQKDTLFCDDRGDELDPSMVFTNLCTRLALHHGVRPVVLVDEYDKPIESMYGKPGFDEAVEYYGSFVRVALKSNINVSRIVVTGVQRIVVRGLFSSLNDFDHIGVAPGAMGEYFGILGDEMRSFIGKCVREVHERASPDEVLRIADAEFSLAAERFDGYCIGGIDVFNPWSAMKFLVDHIIRGRAVESYWNDTAENGIVVAMMSGAREDVLDRVKAMYVSGGWIEAPFSSVTPLWKPGQMLSEKDLLSLLLFAGYLTADTSGGSQKLRIPNREVRENYDVLMERVYCMAFPSVVDLMRHVAQRDASAVRADLERLMEGGSYLDGWKEGRYRSWMHDLFALNGYVAIAERELGEGRADLLVKGYGSRPPAIVELKVLGPDDDGDLSEEAAKGIGQIKDRKYAGSAEMEGAIAFSVAFRKKRCEVAFL